MGGGASEPKKEQNQNLEAQNKDNNVTQKTKNISIGIKSNSIKKSQQKTIKNSAKQTSQQPNSNEVDADLSLNLKLPLCNNKRKATHICLDSDCTIYPFFCLQCEFLCEQSHHHETRLKSISFKQFDKRLAKAKTISSQLSQSQGSYKQTLLQLSQSFDQFYDCQVSFLDDIEIRKSLSPEALMVKSKIEKSQKNDLSGRIIHQLWSQAAQWPKQEDQIISFLKKKEQLIVNLLQTFQNINQANKVVIPPSPSKKKKKKISDKFQQKEISDKNAVHLLNRYELDSQKLEICKEKNWNSGKNTNKKG